MQWTITLIFFFYLLFPHFSYNTIPAIPQSSGENTSHHRAWDKASRFTPVMTALLLIKVQFFA